MNEREDKSHIVQMIGKNYNFERQIAVCHRVTHSPSPRGENHAYSEG